MVPPTMPPFASKLDPPKPTPMNIFLWPVLPIDRRPSDLKSLVNQLQEQDTDYIETGNSNYSS